MNWLKVQLGDIAKIVGGSTPRRERNEYWDGDIPWVTPTDLSMPGQRIDLVETTLSYITKKGLDSCSTQILPIGTVLFSSRATIGKVGIAQVPLTTNQGFANFIPKSVIDSKFLAYVLMFNAKNIEKLAGSTTFKEVTKTSIRKYEIPLPPPKEQRRIVEILDQADELRRKRAEADSKAERILPALFIKMFGDPATNPKGWETDVLDKVVNETQYGTSVKADGNQSGVAVIRMNNINNEGYISLDDLKYVQLDKKELQRQLLTTGDILFNRTNSKELVGKTGIWLGGIEAVPASYLIRVRVNQDLVLPEFIWAFMNTPFIKNILFNKARHAIGMANINARELRSLPCFIPDMSVQQNFVSHLKALEIGREKRNESKKQIESLFNLLLNRAFSGELTAQWREAHLKELLAEMEIQRRELDYAGATTARLF